MTFFYIHSVGNLKSILCSSRRFRQTTLDVKKGQEKVALTDLDRAKNADHAFNLKNIPLLFSLSSIFCSYFAEYYNFRTNIQTPENE